VGLEFELKIIFAKHFIVKTQRFQSMKQFVIILLTLGCMHTNGQAQVVNVESQRLQMDTQRVTAGINFALEYKDNNEETMLKIESAAVLQVKSKDRKNRFLFLANYALAHTTQEVVSNAGAIHFRYSRVLNPQWRWENFVQTQYDQLLHLKSRNLIGSGFRRKLLNTKGLTINAGSLYMFEHERTKENDAITVHKNHRLSSYLVFNIALPKELGEIISTTYWQPRLDLVSDFRISNNTSLNFHFTKHLDFATTWVVTYDSAPPLEVKRRTLSLNNSISYHF
jgi:Protein of unknown function, DUF481